MADEKSVFDKVGGALGGIAATTSDVYERNANVLGKMAVGSRTPKSIAGMARANIFEFPAFVSNTVPMDLAEATCGLLELTYASYLQMAISLGPAVNLADSNDPFVRWKTDTNNYLECSNLTFTFDACHNEIITEDGITFEFNLNSITDEQARIINEALEYEELSEFDHYFQEASRASKRKHLSILDSKAKEAEKRAQQAKEAQAEAERKRDEANKERIDIMRKIDKLDQDARDAYADDTYHDPSKRPEYTNAASDYYRSKQGQRQQMVDNALDNEGTPDQRLSAARREKANADMDVRKSNEDLTLRLNPALDENGKQLETPEGEKLYDPIHSKDAYERIIKKDEAQNIEKDRIQNRSKFFHDTHVKAPEVLDESKIQKINSLKPLTMTVQMKFIEDGSSLNHEAKGTTYTREVIAGVKIFTRLIDAETLPEVAQFPLEEMNKRTRNVRWKAGELKFFKDIVFRIKQKKQTAIDSHDKNRRWYRRLYELAHTTGDTASVGKMTKGKSLIKARLRNELLHFGKEPESGSRGFIPNASIMITKADVDYINLETGIDLLNNGTAMSFCRELFLMSFVVIDTDAQTIKILTPDRHNDFEIHTLASVNKQLAMLDSSTAASREIFKALK